MKTLYLTLNKKAFEVMVTGEKQVEYRRQSGWIKSRLFDKNGNPKKYDYVQFRNGYKKNSPCFSAGYLGVKQAILPHKKIYSNGLEVEIDAGYYMIFLGKIQNINT